MDGQTSTNLSIDSLVGNWYKFPGYDNRTVYVRLDAIQETQDGGYTYTGVDVLFDTAHSGGESVVAHPVERRSFGLLPYFESWGEPTEFIQYMLTMRAAPGEVTSEFQKWVNVIK